MVKLDLNLKEVIGLAENGTIQRKQLTKFLKKFTKEEIEEYIITSVMDEDTGTADEPEPEEPEDEPEPKEPEEDDEVDI